MNRKQLLSKTVRNIELLAKNIGMSSLDFYGLLDQGYKPHRAKTKGFWLFGTKRIVMPRQSGFSKEVAIKDYGDFVKKAGENYIKNIKSRARKELEDAWDRERDEKINVEIEKRVDELAKYSKAAEIGIKKIYQKAREKMIAEYIKKRVEKSLRIVGKIKLLPKKLSDNNFKKPIRGLDFLAEQKRFLLDELPQLDEQERLELLDTLKDVYLLNKEENQAIKKIKESWEKLQV